MSQASNTSSMTAFARAEGAYEQWRWVWEVRGVNGRGLEMRFRTPPGFDALEAALRKFTQSKLKRGTINAGLNLKTEAGDSNIRINEAALKTATQALKKVQLDIECAPPSADGILSLRGVLEQGETDVDPETRKALEQALSKSFVDAIEKLISARREEGAALEAMLSQHLEEVADLTEKAAVHAEATPGAIRDKLHKQLQELLTGSPIPEERLAQEAALLAVRADVREELDRLRAHIEAGRALLKRSGAIGREFDFLVQEFNREANTLCSKASDMELKHLGLDLKKVIDQMREQVQNVE